MAKIPPADSPNAIDAEFKQWGHGWRARIIIGIDRVRDGLLRFVQG